MMPDLIAPLTIGFLGSLHCLGMCGPIVVAYSIQLKPPPIPDASGNLIVGRPLGCILLHHSAFHFGRLVSYGVLGAVAAGLFHAAELGRLFFDIRVNMHLIVGSLLMLSGGFLMKVIPFPSFLGNAYSASVSIVGTRISRLISLPGLLSKAALGFGIGFLPCCLSWAMILTAASTSHVSKGFITMVAFGLGTLPALYFTGIISSGLSRKMRFLGEVAAGFAVSVIGVLMILRGFGVIT